MRQSGLSVEVVPLGLIVLVALVAGSAPTWAGTIPSVPFYVAKP